MADPTSSLHEVAVQAEKALEALATGLGQVGAPPDTVKAVSKMADVTRQIVSALGKSNAEPTPEPAGPPPAPEGGHTIDSATGALHADMQKSAAERA